MWYVIPDSPVWCIWYPYKCVSVIKSLHNNDVMLIASASNWQYYHLFLTRFE